MAKTEKKQESTTPKFVVIDSPGKEPSKPQNPREAYYSREELGKRGIIHPGMKDADVLNAFRNLRTSLLPRMGKMNSSIMVTAINKGGGASFNAINLATAFTLDRQRTALLVDCNFHNPSLAERLNVEAEAGLIDYVSEQTDNIEDIVYPTIVPRLSLVPCGNVFEEDNIEYFAGERMRNFITSATERYEDRVVIIDAPPILDTADTTILSELCDYVLLVLPYQGASAAKVNKTIKALGQDKLLGMVMNN